MAVLGRTMAKAHGQGCRGSHPARHLRRPGDVPRDRRLRQPGRERRRRLRPRRRPAVASSACGDAVNSYWITTTTDDHDADRPHDDPTRGRPRRARAPGRTTVIYDAREQQVAANATLTTMITLLGLLIVAISMVALINTITMAVLERTREIGILRSVGARAREIRRIFATEGLVLALAGWAVGVPLGYAPRTGDRVGRGRGRRPRLRVRVPARVRRHRARRDGRARARRHARPAAPRGALQAR